jgi:hypothetical protein
MDQGSGACMQPISSFSEIKLTFYSSLMGFIITLLLLNMINSYDNLFMQNKLFLFPLWFGVFSSICLTLNIERKISSLILLLLLCLIMNENQSILRVVPGFIGYFLIFLLLNSSNSKFPFLARKNTPELSHVLSKIFVLTIAFSFTYSGISKLFSPAWLSGNALVASINNPRYDSNAMSLISSKPSFLTFLNYCIIVGELAFFPLFLFKKTRGYSIALLLILFISLFFFMKIKIVIGIMLIFIFMIEEKYSEIFFSKKFNLLN